MATASDAREASRPTLETLTKIDEPGTFKGQMLYLTGESLRSLNRFAEALGPLEQAADLLPSNVHVWLALGWCYKRSGQIDRAIHALEQAEEIDAKLAIIQYNLACYWSLAGKKQRALNYLTRARSGFRSDPFRPRLPRVDGDDSLMLPARGAIRHCAAGNIPPSR